MQPELTKFISENTIEQKGNLVTFNVGAFLQLDGKIKTKQDIENLENYNILIEMLKNHTQWKLLDDHELVDFLMDAVYCNQDFRRAKQSNGEK